MSACGTASLRLRVLEEDSASEGDPTDAVLFVGISLVLGIACRQALGGTRVPYTVALLVLGIALGALGFPLPPLSFSLNFYSIELYVARYVCHYAT